MTHTRSEIKAIVVPIAGVCNVGITAKELFLPMQNALERQLDVPVLNPFVPRKLGFQQPLAKTIKEFHAYMAKVSLAFPRAAQILVGHSLGGVLAQEYATTTSAPEIAGVIGLTAPLGGLNEHHWLIHKDRIREINQRTADIGGGNHALAQLGVKYDGVVPWQSALANIAIAEHYLQTTHCSVESKMARVALRCVGLGRGVVEHNAALWEPKNIELVTYLTGSMLQNAGVQLPPEMYERQYDPTPLRHVA